MNKQPRYISNLIKAAIIASLALICFGLPVQAQYPGAFGPPPPHSGSKGGFLSQISEHDLPGLADPCSPLVLPPVFRMELRTRPLVVWLRGHLDNADTGRRLDFQDDLGFPEIGVLWETMYRIQFSRLSFRLHYSAYLKGMEGSEPNEFDWPVVYGGPSIAVIDTPSFRLGLDADFYAQRPRFVYANTPLGTGSFDREQPIAAGVHASWNPVGYLGLSGSVEGRWRMSVSSDPRMQEVEVSAGLKTPELVLGTFATRLGWRYSTYKCSDGGAIDVTALWTGIFADFVYYY